MRVLYGWTGRILRVDLTEDRISFEDTTRYSDGYIGGRGIASKIAWDEIRPNLDPFDPENRLIAMTGPLSGTIGSGTGRTQFCTTAPQIYPRPKVTRSSMGGPWAAKLKYAGFDGLIVQGKAEKPVLLFIHDQDVEIVNASHLWGLDIFATQKALAKQYGSEASTIAIGPAGERLSRISIIGNETENAAGQGGFGGVMGSKGLKAVTVIGTGGVKVADPDGLMKTIRKIKKVVGTHDTQTLKPINGKYEQKRLGCHGCPNPCSTMVLNVPGKHLPQESSCKVTCVESRWLEEGWNIPHKDYRNTYPELPKREPGIRDVESSFEAKVFGDKYGINMWEMTIGLVPWLKLCVENGDMTEQDIGMPIELNRGEFWTELFRRIAYREGIGDVLAEGLPRAADRLGKGHRYLTHVAHGYAEHWLGRGIQSPLGFPYWIISALCWATDSRDPFSDHHRSYELGWATRYLTPEQERNISKTLYGSEETNQPNYSNKAQRTIWHQNRCCLDESLVLCESGGFPIIGSGATSNGFGYPEAESDLYSTVTGLETSQIELDEMGERVFNLERAIMVREGRSRNYDIECGVINYLKNRPDRDGIVLDETKFTQCLDEYYRLRGWDIETGRPSRETLLKLRLDDVASRLEGPRLPQ